MFCKKCGKEIKDDALFCTNCGTPTASADRPNGSAAEGGAAVRTSGGKTLIILVIMVAVFFIIIFVFFSIVRSMNKNGDETFTDSDGAAHAANEPFKGFGSLSVGDRVVFGRYEQDGNTNNGAEPLEWDVVGTDNGKYMLITHYVIDYMQFDDGTADTSVNAGGNALDAVVTWEKCSLRKWLNGDFYSNTFTDEERAYITPVSNYNASWVEFADNRMGAASTEVGGYGGKVTKDKVFLLSVQEIPAYLEPIVYFPFWSRNFYPGAIASATKYAQEKATWSVCKTMEDLFGSPEVRSRSDSDWRLYYEGYVDSDYIEKEAFLHWFTRSPGCYRDSSAEFTIGQEGGPKPGFLKSNYAGVRPVVWVTP